MTAPKDDTTKARIFEWDTGDWWAECLVCREWVSTANTTRRDAEQKIGRHLQSDHRTDDSKRHLR